MKDKLEDGEIELSNNNIANPLLDDLLKNAQTCTHTHTCNPPGPDFAHTHTCYHTHTHVIPSQEDSVPRGEKSPVSKPRRPSGNREAVKKYREKKKAHTAYLEEEVKKLRHVNKVLMGKLQKQAILEKEIVRLRGLLFDLRGKIDKELGDFPFRKQCDSISDVKEGECGVRPIGSFECEVNEKYTESVEKCS